jgi:tetratricopeptide (TPR) repeat protein
MLGQGWLALRQAQEALKNGRLDDAQRILGQPAAQGQRGAAVLYRKLAQAFVARGEGRLNGDDAEAAWRDLFKAEELEAAPRACDRLRQALARLGLAEVRALLEAGEPARAEETAARLRDRRVRLPELRVLLETAGEWRAARELADRGEFGAAREAAERAARLRRDLPPLERWRQDLEPSGQKLAALLPRLHEAVTAARWREVVELAEQVLAIAPQHAETRKARTRAWKAIEPVTVAMRGPDAEPERPNPRPEGAPPRFLLWIDGVGGYLICLGSRLTFGQATAGDRVDVPLVADVSRLHASLTRDGEGYVLEAVRPVQVNGQPATRALLRPGDRVTLGASCQFVFRVPVPVSGTARLDLVSGHRVPLGVDGVLLMADTLVLGDGAQVHVTVPDLRRPIVFYRHKDGLGLRHHGGLTIDGKPVPERSPLPLPAHVAGEDVSFAVEPIGR